MDCGRNGSGFVFDVDDGVDFGVGGNIPSGVASNCVNFIQDIFDCAAIVVSSYIQSLLSVLIVSLLSGC